MEPCQAMPWHFVCNVYPMLRFAAHCAKLSLACCPSPTIQHSTRYTNNATHTDPTSLLSLSAPALLPHAVISVTA